MIPLAYVIVASWTLSLILTMFLAVIVLTTPAWTLFWAKITKKHFVLELGRDKVLRLHVARKIPNIPALQTKTGVYEYGHDDMFIFQGRPAGLWYEGYKKALRIELLPLIRELKKMGIEDKDQFLSIMELAKVAEKVSEEELERRIQKMYPNANPEVWNKIKDTVEKVRNMKVDVEGRIVRPWDIVNYLEEANPYTELALIERAVMIERRKWKDNFTATMARIFPYVIVILALMFGGVIAYKMLVGGAVSLPHPAPPSGGVPTRIGR